MPVATIPTAATAMRVNRIASLPKNVFAPVAQPARYRMRCLKSHKPKYRGAISFGLCRSCVSRTDRNKGSRARLSSGTRQLHRGNCEQWTKGVSQHTLRRAAAHGVKNAMMAGSRHANEVHVVFSCNIQDRLYDIAVPEHDLILCFVDCWRCRSNMQKPHCDIDTRQAKRKLPRGFNRGGTDRDGSTGTSTRRSLKSPVT